MPAIAFTMQSRLVGDIPFGRAYSAVAVSALYLVLARGLWRRTPELRALAEAFLALSVVFLTLAIPLAFGGHVVAAGWALEGAALVWVGFTQHRLLARTVGALLLFGAGIAFGLMSGPVSRDLPVLNSAFLGSAAIAIASGRRRVSVLPLRGSPPARGSGARVDHARVGTAVVGRRDPDRSGGGDHQRHDGAGVVERVRGDRRRPGGDREVEDVAGARLLLPAVPPDPGAARRSARGCSTGSRGRGANGGWAAWPAAMLGSFILLWLLDRRVATRVARAWHAGTTWLLVFLLTWTAAAATSLAVPSRPPGAW